MADCASPQAYFKQCCFVDGNERGNCGFTADPPAWSPCMLWTWIEAFIPLPDPSWCSVGTTRTSPIISLLACLFYSTSSPICTFSLRTPIAWTSHACVNGPWTVEDATTVRRSSSPLSSLLRSMLWPGVPLLVSIIAHCMYYKCCTEWIRIQSEERLGKAEMSTPRCAPCLN